MNEGGKGTRRKKGSERENHQGGEGEMNEEEGGREWRDGSDNMVPFLGCLVTVALILLFQSNAE